MKYQLFFEYKEMKKKIFIIIPKFKIGGAEKVMINIANELSKYDLQIYFITLQNLKKLF